MFVLGIDPGLSRCGYGLVRQDKGDLSAVAGGVVGTPPDLPTPQRLGVLYSELTALVAETRPDAVVVETDESSREARWGLEAALETLPEDQRDVVMMRHLVGLTPGEIATRMGRTESSIHGLHHRGRLALRRELSDLDCAPVARAA